MALSIKDVFRVSYPVKSNWSVETRMLYFATRSESKAFVEDLLLKSKAEHGAFGHPLMGHEVVTDVVALLETPGATPAFRRLYSLGTPITLSEAPAPASPPSASAKQGMSK